MNDFINVPPVDKVQYRIRTPVKGRKSFVVTVPYVVVERQAKRKGLSIPDFIAQYYITGIHGGNSEGIFYIFEKIIPNDGTNSDR